LVLVVSGIAAAIAALLVPLWNHLQRGEERPVAQSPPAADAPATRGNIQALPASLPKSNEPLGSGPVASGPVPGSRPVGPAGPAAPSGPAVAGGKPPPVGAARPRSGDEWKRQQQVMVELKQFLASQADDADKVARVARAMADESDPGLRVRILESAESVRGPVLEEFLTGLLKTEEDASVHSQAATALGRTGSEKSLGVLSNVAASDRTTSAHRGHIQGSSSARRPAIFAIAELAGRFPRIADKAAAELRALPDVSEVPDDESLADARLQALYQVTRDAALLQPFYERLKSDDANERIRGVVAFRFLKMTEAPPEIVKALQDNSTEVRSWAALVLGDIGDKKPGPALIAIADDTREAGGLRCNAINALGRMKYTAAAELMERLLTDSEPAVPSNAAIALYRITGRKVKQFPEGYRTD
jgi:HEAT repeat protein